MKAATKSGEKDTSERPNARKKHRRRWQECCCRSGAEYARCRSRSSTRFTISSRRETVSLVTSHSESRVAKAPSASGGLATKSKSRSNTPSVTVASVAWNSSGDCRLRRLTFSNR